MYLDPLARSKHHVCRITGIRLAVHAYFDLALHSAHLRHCQRHIPLGEQLAEGEVLTGLVGYRSKRGLILECTPRATGRL